MTRKVRTGTHRDAHRRFGERGRIIDAVTDHDDASSGLDEVANAAQLILGHELCLALPNAEFACNPLRDAAPIPGEQNGIQSHRANT